jgi:phosphatidyl-myo-inositol dimannoside synthase
VHKSVHGRVRTVHGGSLLVHCVPQRTGRGGSVAPTLPLPPPVTLPRILLVMTEFPPRIGGMQTHGVHLVRHLAARGYPGAVLTHCPTRSDEVDRWRRVDAEMPLPVHRILSRISHWATLQRIEAFARDWKPDLVYCSTVFYGALQERLGVPVLCRSVGNDVMRPWIAWPFRPFSRLLGVARLERWLVDLYERVHSPEWVERLVRDKRRQLTEASARQMSTIIANSEFTAGLLRHTGVLPDRMEVLVGGVDVACFTPREPGQADVQAARRRLGLPAEAWLMTTACRLVPKKGIDFLLSAFGALRVHMPDAQLVVIGSGPKARHWLTLAREAGLTGAVHFVGRVEHDDMPAYYWASDAFVLASRVHVSRRSGLSDVETMGRVLCEANAAGTPVLASRSGGIPSVIEDGVNGRLFEPDDTDDFIAKACALRQDVLTTRAMAERGRMIAAQRFDWSVIVGRHEALFRQSLR